MTTCNIQSTKTILNKIIARGGGSTIYIEGVVNNTTGGLIDTTSYVKTYMESKDIHVLVAPSFPDTETDRYCRYAIMLIHAAKYIDNYKLYYIECESTKTEALARTSDR